MVLHIFAHSFLNIQLLYTLKHVKDVEDYIMQHYMESMHYIGTHVKDVKGVKYYD